MTVSTFIRRYAALFGDFVALLSLMLVIFGGLFILGALTSECLSCGAL